ncbi:MAG: hypothetical protein ACXWB9_05155 [Flavisolibacter sp.]
MMRRFFSLLFLVCFLDLVAMAQDTLPNFSVKNAGRNRYIIGWVNDYPIVKQIGIQRSHDSLVNFKTILSVADPNVRENGYADSKAPNDHMFYRLFIVLDKGQYFYTASRKPFTDTTTGIRRNSLLDRIEDSITAVIRPIVPKKPEFIPSFYIYTNKDGYVYINLPDADKKRYEVKFYEEDDSFLFEIKNIRETGITLDKANFIHSGWFKFELYKEGKLVEKNRFYLAKEF